MSQQTDWLLHVALLSFTSQYILYSLINQKKESMKKFIPLLLAIALIGVQPMHGQLSRRIQHSKESARRTQQNNRIATYPGGRVALDRYVKRHLETNHLMKLAKNFPNPRVVMEFDIDTQGRVRNLHKISSPHSGFTDEAARVMRNLPAWYPALRNGRPYVSKQRYTVYFDLHQRRYNTSDRVAMFPGGRVALNRYVRTHLRTDHLRKLRGRFANPRVVMEFSIDTEGNVIRLNKISSPHSGLTDEAARVIRSLPRWRPAIREGRPVISTQRYTVHFNL